MIRQIVVAKIQHAGIHPRLGSNQTIPQWLVLRHGFCDFENNGIFNSVNEMIIAKDFSFVPEINIQDWRLALQQSGQI